jgi:DNA repair protein RadC
MQTSLGADGKRAPPARDPAWTGADVAVGIEVGIEVGALSAAELIARVVARDPLELDVAPGDLAELARRSPADLRARLGLPLAGALGLAAAFELGRRVERAAAAVRAPMHAPALVHAVAAPLLRGLDREEFHALLLDARHRLMRTAHVSTGTLSTSLVHPREVFVAALRESAAAIVVVHNHPSGDPEPSQQDLEVTRRLLQVGELVGVPLLDHVVVAADRWVSLRERMTWSVPAGGS